MRFIPIKERFFEYIDNVAWCFDKALTEAGISVNYYRKEKSEGNKRIMFMDHPTDRRYSLVAFETMSDSHKQKIIARFGNPYIYITREPILRMLQPDDKAYQFFLSYRYNDDKILPISRIKQYTRAAQWLNLLKEVEDSRNKIIKDMGIKVPEFFDHVEALMNMEKGNGMSETFEGANQLYARCPTSYRKLKPKLNEYMEKGPVVLIDKMYGNQLAAKVKDEVAEAQLLTLIENPLQYDDVLVCKMYNIWAAANSYKEIDPSTVGVWRRKKGYLVTMGREGNSAYNEKYIRQVKGFRPQLPLSLVEHDDNNLDFLFHNTEDKYISKYVAITVTDSSCDLVLGKSYIMSKRPQQWQVKHAYLDMMYYIRSLTGGWHLQHETKSDKGHGSSLIPFYESMGKYVPAAHGNKHRGYEEQVFGTKHWKRCQQLVSEGNWSGNNIWAKFRGVNEEVLKYNQAKRNLPMIGQEAELQIEKFFYLLRHLPAFKREDMGAPSKEVQWLEKWNATHIDDKRPISDEQFLLTFGITHEPKHTDFIRITNRGVEPQINKAQYSYDLPEAWMYDKLQGAKVQVVYDPFDMSRVLITNHDDIRFIAKTAQLSPRALKDQYTGSRTYLNAILAEKNEQVQRVGASSSKRKEVADSRFYNAEAMLQGGSMLKEIKNEAEHKMLEQDAVQFEEYLDSNIDVNDYL